LCLPLSRRNLLYSVHNNHLIIMNRPMNRACLFIRVSTSGQDYERQILELNEFCKQKNLEVVETIATKITGTKTFQDREDLQQLFKSAAFKKFDKVVVSEISRIGRNAKDIRNTIDYLHSKKIAIVFRNLGGLESLDDKGSESFVTNIIIAIYSELAQEEKRILSDRIKSGLVSARHKGKRIGRPEGKQDDETLLKRYSRLAADLRKGLSLSQCQKLHDVSRNTAIKIRRLCMNQSPA
jgi:DNA invertase Pin-like site-specific DNA recombinase